MTTGGYGVRGPDFYTDMNSTELAAHQARDNGDPTPEMVQFDADIETIRQMSPADRALVAQLKWEALTNG